MEVIIMGKTIEFSKSYKDGRVITITYYDNGEYTKAQLNRQLAKEKNHQNCKYENYFSSDHGIEDALEAYKELCKSLDFN
jgi:hypothetical protein